jgi:hypothetical protein
MLPYATPARTLLFGLALGCPGALLAQPYYAFSQLTEPYAEITGGTAVAIDVSSGWGQITALDGTSFPVTGAAFPIGGTRQIWIHDSGFLNIDYAPVNTVFISAMFHSFTGLIPADGTASLTYVVTGAPGDLHLTVQWENYRRSDGQAGHFVNFQIQMHQASGIIEVRYGPNANGGATYTAANGPNAGYYFADYDQSPLYDRIWLSGSPAAPALSTALSPAFTGLNALPAAGTVYRFTPVEQVGMVEHAAGADLFQAGIDPASGLLSIRFAHAAENGTVVLLGADGRRLVTERRTSDRMVIDLHQLPAAMYLAAYHADDGQRQVIRVVKP